MDSKKITRFVALCPRYPEYSLTVHKLKRVLEEEGFFQPAPVIHFHNGIYDSRLEELPEAGVPIAYEALMQCEDFKRNLISVQTYKE